MKQIIFISLAFLFFATSNNSFAQKAKYKSKLQTEKFVIDSKSDAWLTDVSYDSKSKFNYGITNDSKNLYVRIKVIDEALQIKMLRAGFTLWIDTTAKKKQQFAIKHPLEDIGGGLPNERKKMSENSDIKGNRPREPKKIMMKNDPRIQLIAHGNNDTININSNKFGIKISMIQDPTGNLYYIATIPFKTIYNNNKAQNLSKLISIGLETGSLDVAQSKQPSDGGQGGGRSQGGGHGGGHGGGGRSGGSRGGGDKNAGGNAKETMQQSLSTPSELWIKKIGLAK